MFDLAISKFRKYRQAQARVANPLGHRHRTALVAELRVGGLQMQRHGINQVGADFLLGEVFAQRVAAGVADRELVEHALPVSRLFRQVDVGEMAPAGACRY